MTWSPEPADEPLDPAPAVDVPAGLGVSLGEGVVDSDGVALAESLGVGVAESLGAESTTRSVALPSLLWCGRVRTTAMPTTATSTASTAAAVRRPPRSTSTPRSRTKGYSR